MGNVQDATSHVEEANKETTAATPVELFAGHAYLPLIGDQRAPRAILVKPHPSKHFLRAGSRKFVGQELATVGFRTVPNRLSTCDPPPRDCLSSLLCSVRLNAAKPELSVNPSAHTCQIVHPSNHLLGIN